MILTEEDAKTKWCPFASVATPGDSAFSRTPHDQPAGFCLGSKCMAWRWDGKPYGYCGMTGKQ